MNTPEIPSSVPVSNAKNGRFELWSVAFSLSAGLLVYEILLTRIASVMLTSDHVFLVLALALLGLAGGAIAEYFLAARHGSRDVPLPGLWLSGVGAAMVIALVMLLVGGPAGGPLVLALSAALPFAGAGLAYSRLFRLFPAYAGSLYGADLVGAAAGALLVPWSIGALGPVQSIVLVATLQTGIGLFLVLRRGRGAGRFTFAAAGCVLLAGGLLTANWDQRLLGPVPVGLGADKDLSRLANTVGGFELVESRWSTFGRTDLVRFARDSDSMSIFIDGAAGSPMYRFSGDTDGRSSELPPVNRGFAGGLVMELLTSEQRDNALIIGPGGGRDVLLALQAGINRITAVDVNPQMIEIVKDHSDYNGGLYTNFANVEVINAEGRRFLSESDDRYDLITLFMPITKSSRGLNTFALSESYLFTVEAMQDYHDHLTPEGQLLIMAHGMEEAAKLTLTGVAALEREGMTPPEAMQHVYVLGSHMMPYVVITKRPLDGERRDLVHAVTHSPLFDPQFSYVPGINQEWSRPPDTTAGGGDGPMMNPLFYGLADGTLTPSRIERALGINLAPATDARPFFSQFGFGAPAVVTNTLWIALGVLLAVLMVPFFRIRGERDPPSRAAGVWLPVWFAAIGAGYIAIELVLFQKLVFLLGDPSRSLALLLAALLLGSGVGSLASIRFADRLAVGAALVTAALAALMVWLLPWLFQGLAQASDPRKLAVAGLALFVQGVPMGVLFPIGIRVGWLRLGSVAAPWMWAVNGAASVVGSALTILIAMSAGYTAALGFGVTCYVLAAVSAYRLTVRVEPTRSSKVQNDEFHYV